MARKGPLTVQTNAITLGMAQIRIGDSSTNIANIQPVLTSTDSIGAMASTKFVANTDWFRHESGFPLVEDYLVAIRDNAALECAFEETTPANLALTYGEDPNSAPYSTMDYNSGEVPLGNRSAPDYVRMESRYTYPVGTNYMDIIFPRAQVSASTEIDFQADTAAAVTIMIESKRADSDVSGGNAVWDDKPLGRIFWSHD